MPGYKRILVIRLGAFGDVVRSFPTMAALRHHHADAHITLLTTKAFVDMTQKSGYFDRVWDIQRWRWNQPLSWLRFARQMREDGYDYVYDLQRNDRTLIFNLLAPASLRRHWFGGKMGNPTTAEALDAEEITRFPIPDLSWMNADISSLGMAEPFFLLVPGSSPQNPEKRWPAAHYAKLALMLAEKGITPVILGGAAEKYEASLIAAASPAVRDLTGKTSFMDIAALARRAAGAVGNDTGPIHLIAMAGCPCVTLFSGASDPAQSKPMGPHVSVLRADPIADISVEQVVQVLDAWLLESPKQNRGKA